MNRTSLCTSYWVVPSFVFGIRFISLLDQVLPDCGSAFTSFDFLYSFNWNIHRNKFFFLTFLILLRFHFSCSGNIQLRLKPDLLDSISWSNSSSSLLGLIYLWNGKDCCNSFLELWWDRVSSTIRPLNWIFQIMVPVIVHFMFHFIIYWCHRTLRSNALRQKLVTDLQSGDKSILLHSDDSDDDWTRSLSFFLSVFLSFCLSVFSSFCLSPFSLFRTRCGFSFSFLSFSFSLSRRWLTWK